MKKKLTPLICGIIILAILIVLYVVGSARKNKTTETKESTITQDEIGQKLSTNDNAVDILVENKNGKFEFEKAKDSWKIKGYKDVTLSNDAVNLIINGVESLYAIETIEENPQSVEKYGLSKEIMQAKDGYKNSLYYPHREDNIIDGDNNVTCRKYWLVSPSAAILFDLITIQNDGYIIYHDCTNNSGDEAALRPVVSLNSEIKVNATDAE